jgi:nucleoside-diphosphate-sugar epimerase
MRDLKGKTIAIVGGAGFIGHNMALTMKACGADVHVIDGLNVNSMLFLYSHDCPLEERKFYRNVITSRLDLLEEAEIPLHILDARDYHAISRTLTSIKPQVIVHLAAVSHANRSNKDPYSTFDHSLRTLENTLDWTRGSKLERYVYYSSSMVYGNFESGIVDEETVCNPLGIYGALKFSGEKMVMAYNQVFDLPYTIIRPSALYGERCISRRVNQIFIEKAFQGETIQINGDGSDKLDFTYIQDLIDGTILAMDKEEGKNEIFNITFGGARSLAEVVEILKGYFEKMNVEYLPKDKLMPDRGTLSVEKAKSVLGYESQYPIEVGLERYIDWYKSLYKKNS